MTVYESIKAAASVVVAVFLCSLLYSAQQAVERFDPRLSSIQADANRHAETLEALAHGTAGKALSTVNAAVQRADARTGETLSTVRTVAASADTQLTETRQMLDGQLRAVNATLAGTAVSVNDLARRYTVLPDQIAQDRVFKAYTANGLGLIAATKLTMGQVEKSSRVFGDKFPSLLNSFDQTAKANTGIFVNVQRFTDRAIAPCRGWCIVRSTLGTATGAARAYAAFQ